MTTDERRGQRGRDEDEDEDRHGRHDERVDGRGLGRCLSTTLEDPRSRATQSPGGLELDASTGCPGSGRSAGLTLALVRGEIGLYKTKREGKGSKACVYACVRVWPSGEGRAEGSARSPHQQHNTRHRDTETWNHPSAQHCSRGRHNATYRPRTRVHLAPPRARSPGRVGDEPCTGAAWGPYGTILVAEILSESTLYLIHSTSMRRFCLR